MISDDISQLVQEAGLNISTTGEQKVQVYGSAAQCIVTNEQRSPHGSYADLLFNNHLDDTQSFRISELLAAQKSNEIMPIPCARADCSDRLGEILELLCAEHVSLLQDRRSYETGYEQVRNWRRDITERFANQGHYNVLDRLWSSNNYQEFIEAFEKLPVEPNETQIRRYKFALRKSEMK